MLIKHEVAAPRLRPCRGTVAFILTKTSTEAKRVCRTSVWLQRAVVEGEIEPGVAAAACAEGPVSKLGGQAAMPPDRVRPSRGGPTSIARARQAGDLRLPGLHLHLRHRAPRRLPGPAEEPARPWDPASAPAGLYPKTYSPMPKVVPSI